MVFIKRFEFENKKLWKLTNLKLKHSFEPIRLEANASLSIDFFVVFVLLHIFYDIYIFH